MTLDDTLLPVVFHVSIGPSTNYAMAWVCWTSAEGEPRWARMIEAKAWVGRREVYQIVLPRIETTPPPHNLREWATATTPEQRQRHAFDCVLTVGFHNCLP